MVRVLKLVLWWKNSEKSKGKWSKGYGKSEKEKKVMQSMEYRIDKIEERMILMPGGS